MVLSSLCQLFFKGCLRFSLADLQIWGHPSVPKAGKVKTKEKHILLQVSLTFWLLPLKGAPWYDYDDRDFRSWSQLIDYNSGLTEITFKGTLPGKAHHPPTVLKPWFAPQNRSTHIPHYCLLSLPVTPEFCLHFRSTQISEMFLRRGPTLDFH